MKNKGFTLIEILVIIIVLILIFFITFPIVIKIIDTSKLGSFKSEVSSVFDSVEYYIANNKFVDITSSGLQIENNSSLKIKNNDFDKGYVIRNENGELELLYLIKGDFCAIGTEKELRVSDSGCGALDETAPISVEPLKLSATNNSITVFSKVVEEESKIVKYYYRIDNEKYIETTTNKYTFTNISGEHTFQIKVVNEAGLSSESEEVKISTSESKIFCDILGDKIDNEKKANCSFEANENYIYQYKINEEYITLEQNSLELTINEKSKIDIRIIENNKVIATTEIDINNIDSELNGAYPYLLDNMIPVTYDENKKTYVKASEDEIYWDYANKKYANAVIVKKYKDAQDENSHSREYYLSNEATHKEINENDIIAVFVWIPRFKYQLFNVLSETKEKSLINIIFESNDTTKTKSKTLASNGEYITHPAFTFGNLELNGFWVSKYPASIDENSECSKNTTIANCNKADDTLIYFKKNRKVLTDISVANAFQLSLNIKDNANYDINGDTHLLKNTEWGAIAYLANSKYGVDVKANTGEKTSDNVEFSTTGNMTGVFDMSGLKYEMVMGNYNKDAGLDEEVNSGFSPYGSISFPEEKYYDLYTSITEKGMILGDATSEVKGWSNVANSFVNGSTPFFIRGGKSDLNASIYAYESYSGNPRDDISFRIALCLK